MGITREMIVIIEDEKLIFFIERIIYGGIHLIAIFISKLFHCVCGIKAMRNRASVEPK